MSWEHLKLNPVDVKDDSHTFQVEMPASVTDDVMWMIAKLGKVLEQGNASLDLREVDGRPTLFLTIRTPGFPLTIDATKGVKQ